MEASDSSHSGIGVVATLWRRVGLDGAEAAKSGWRKELREPLERDSKSDFRFELLEVGDERGGVTGALLEILRGGRFAGIDVMLRINGRRNEEGFASMREGLGKEDEVGLAW